MAEGPSLGAAFARRRRRRLRGESQAGGGGAVVEGEPCPDGMFHPHHALNVPRLQLEASVDGPVTTVMLRHIPCKYTQGSLLRELDEVGFQGKYDFFYLPMDRQNKTSVGYAFVNFVEARDAQQFMDTMTGYRFQRHPNSKVAAASPAHLQGLRRNATHFASRAILRARDAKSRPVVLQGGFRRDLGELAAEFLQEDQEIELAALTSPRASEAGPSAEGPVVPAQTALEHPPIESLCSHIAPVESGEASVVFLRASEAGPSAEGPVVPAQTALEHLPIESLCSHIAPVASGEASVVFLRSPRSNVAFEAARHGFETALVGVLRRQQIEVKVAGPASRGRKVRMSWVDRAIGLLVEELGHVPPKGTAGCWITEAFVALVGSASKGDKQLLDMAPAFDAESSEQRCWVADAFRSLVGKVAKSRFDMGEAEAASDTSSVPTTPRGLNAPCGVGDALQRLQALGGWAWVAFA